MTAKKAAASTTSSGTAAKKSAGLSAAEKAAVKERAAELKAQARKEDGGKAVLAKIAEMPKADRELAERVHEIVTGAAPHLVPKTWYGMPAYAKDDKIVCFFQGADKFDARYSTLGFNDAARLDDGNMWATAFALVKLTKAVEADITALVKRAAGTES